MDYTDADEAEARASLEGVVWGDEKPHAGSRCPVCALPLRWGPSKNPGLPNWRCFGPVSADRHAAIDRKRRAAALCLAADYEAFSVAILVDIERLRTPAAQSAA